MQDSEKELVAKKVRELAEQMKLYNDPESVEEVRAIIRKNVPFYMRGNFAAYLYLNMGSSAPRRDKAPRQASQQKPQGQARENTAAAADADGVTYYINVGKLSKAPAREMVDFICETAKISSEDVLAVSYKQNYSFVTIAKAKTEGIIDAVNGQTYRGRKVKFALSREKEAE